MATWKQCAQLRETEMFELIERHGGDMDDERIDAMLAQ